MRGELPGRAFHAVGSWRCGSTLALGLDPAFTVLDRGDAASLSISCAPMAVSMAIGDFAQDTRPRSTHARSTRGMSGGG
jgi:hypothetical protein